MLLSAGEIVIVDAKRDESRGRENCASGTFATGKELDSPPGEQGRLEFLRHGADPVRGRFLHDHSRRQHHLPPGEKEFVSVADPSTKRGIIPPPQQGAGQRYSPPTADSP